MISISKMTSGNSVVINELPSSDTYEGVARVGRYKSLDGGVIIDHQGYVAGDQTLQINCELSENDETILKNLFENETIVHVSTKYGFFTAAICALTIDSGNMSESILLKAAA